MTRAQCTGLVSAILGAMGTIFLFFSSYALQSLEGGIFGSDQLTESNKHIKAKNRCRLIWQRIGLLFLLMSFAAQAIALLL
jgi:hypothetical protein